MKTLYLQLSELEDDFFLLSEGGNDDVHEGSQTTRPTSANRKNFVIKCLEVGVELVNTNNILIISISTCNCNCNCNFCLIDWE